MTRAFERCAAGASALLVASSLAAPTAALAQSRGAAGPTAGCVGSTYESAKRAYARMTAQRTRAMRSAGAPAAGTQTTQTEGDRPVVTTTNTTSEVVTKTTISSDALQSSNSQNTYDAIKNVPGVVQTDTRGGSVTDSLQIRGIKLSSTTSYRLDGGLPLVNNIALPVEDKCRVEALKGAGALEFGIASPAGIVNYVLKRAGDVPNASFSVVGNQYGQAVGAVDYGGRFGGNYQLGLRVNLAEGEYGSFVVGAGGTRYLVAVTSDWTPSDRFSTKIDYEQFGIDIIEQAPLQLLKAVNNQIPIPRVPDPTKLLSAPWARSVGVGQNVSLRTQWNMGGGFALVGEIGRSAGNRPQRNVGQISNYDLITGKGTETFTLITNQKTINQFVDVHLHNYSDWGRSTNDVTYGVTHSERNFNNPQNTTATYTQNIYNPTYLQAPVRPSSPVDLPNNSFDDDVYFSDTFTLGRLKLLGGIRQISYTSQSVTKAFKQLTTQQAVLAPAAGFVYDVGRASVYASYLQSLEESGQAPVNAVNAYSVLPPARATQREIGLRTSGRLATTVGFFSINKGNATTDPTTNLFALNGTINYQGLESTAAYDLTRRLTLNAGVQLMRARQDSIGDPSINGKTPENTPNFSGNAGFTVRPGSPGGLGFNLGMIFFSRRPINPQNQGYIPGVATLSAGANLTRRIAGHRYTFNLNAQNALDKRYYSSAISGAFGVGAPRVISLTSRVDL